MAEGNKSLGRFRLSGIPPAPRGVPQVQVSFDIDANGLLQVSATDRTTGRQQSVSIQGGTNLSEEEINRLLEEAEQKAVEDRRKRSEIDRRNRAQTLVSQAERRLRDAALELGPYGAERQQRSVELALRDVQDLLRSEDTAELELAVSQLQEALFGLNRRLMSERRAEAGPLQGIKNTLGSLRDELFADDDDDAWDRDGRSDPWASVPRRPPMDRFSERSVSFPPTGLGRGGAVRYDSRDDGQLDRWDPGREQRFGRGSGYLPPEDGGRGSWSNPTPARRDPGGYGGDSYPQRDTDREPPSGRDGEAPPERDYTTNDPDGYQGRREPSPAPRRDVSPSRRPQPFADPDDPWGNG